MMRIEAMKPVIDLLHYKNNDLALHGERLWQYAECIGRKLCLSQDDLINLEVLCKLHDVGKLLIREDVLMKSSSLTDEEWRLIKEHPDIGYKMIYTVPRLMHIAELIRHHHERWDGKGFPCHLAGDNIPLLCRIISVVDAYDAMTSERVYCEAVSIEDAIIELIEHAGSQFDPLIVDVFLQVLNDARVLLP